MDNQKSYFPIDFFLKKGDVVYCIQEFDVKEGTIEDIQISYGDVWVDIKYTEARKLLINNNTAYYTGLSLKNERITEIVYKEREQAEEALKNKKIVVE